MYSRLQNASKNNTISENWPCLHTGLSAAVSLMASLERTVERMEYLGVSTSSNVADADV